MTERTLLKQTRAEFEDDAISITSSRSEQYSSDQEFLVERILAEKKGQDGKMYFLIFWANYPEEKSTWEPTKNIQDPEILQGWKQRRDQEAKGIKPSFNIAKFDARLQELAQAKKDRRRRRKIKRKHLAIPVSTDGPPDDNDSKEAVESDATPNDGLDMRVKTKAPQRPKNPGGKPFVQPESSDIEAPRTRRRTSVQIDEYESDGSGTSDDSLIGDLNRKIRKKQAQKKATQAIRDKRAAYGPSRVATGEDKSASKKPLQKAGATRPTSSSSSDIPLVEVQQQQKQSQQRSESTETAISRQFASTSRASPKLVSINSSAKNTSSKGHQRPAAGASSSVVRGRGATRGGSSLTPKNVFASRAPPKKRPTLIENAADASKDPKHFTNMRLRRKAQLAGRERADAAPDISALGGLFAPSDPSTFQSLKPVPLRKSSNLAPNQQDADLNDYIDIDDLFVNQSSTTNDGGMNAWDPNLDIDPAPQYSPPPQNVLGSRPQWQQRHGYNAICHFWHMKGSCNKGYQCSFKHANDDHLPIGPPPPGHHSLFDPSDQSLVNQYSPLGPSSNMQHSPPALSPVVQHSPPEYTSTFHQVPPVSSSRPSNGPSKGPWDTPDNWPEHPRAVCFFWHTRGNCVKGENCGYFHSYEGNLPIAAAPNPRALADTKRETCAFWAKGFCRKSDEDCKYFHGYRQAQDTTLDQPQSRQQPEPSRPPPVVQDGTGTISAGLRKQVSFALDEPTIFSDEPESYNAPKPVPTQPSSMDKNYNKTCRFWSQGRCSFGSKCRLWHSYDGSDKRAQSMDEGIRQDITKSHTFSLLSGQYIGSATAIDFVDSTRGSDLFHPDRLQLLQGDTARSTQTELALLKLQTDDAHSNPQKRLGGQGQTETSPQPITRLQMEVDTTALSPVPGTSKTATPKFKRAKISIDKYKRDQAIKALGDRAKEVAFGKDETKFVIVDFGDLTQAKELPWGQSFISLAKLHFTQICLAQDFKCQIGSLMHQKLWQGSLAPESTDREALQMMNKAWEHLRLSSAGFVSVCTEFVVLLYPAIEEWKFIEGSASFSSEVRLRYLVFQSNLDLSTPPDTSLTSKPVDYRKSLVKVVHGLDFKLFVPKLKKGQTYHFYLLFPSTANKTADFLTNWLRTSSNQIKVYSSQTEGSWNFFVKFVKDASIDVGLVLIHESLVVSLCELPGLRELFDHTRAITFWYIAEGGSECPMYGPPEGSSLGQITATRLLPHGHAFFLTPSFLISDPDRAFRVIRWFLKDKSRNSTPGTWKLVCAHNIRDYLLDVAMEKSKEKDELEVKHQNDPRKDSIIDEKGLSYATCKLRFQMHELVAEALTHQISENYSDYDSEVPNETNSPIIYASEFVDPDDEQELMTWFAGWAMGKLDQFRKFTVVGSAPKYEKRAVRGKAVIQRAQSPKLVKRSNTGSPKPTRRFRDHPAISRAEPLKTVSTPVKSPAFITEPLPSAGKARALEIATKLNSLAPTTPLSAPKAQEKNSFDDQVPSVQDSTITSTLPPKPQGPIVGTLGGHTVTPPTTTSATSPDSDIEISIEDLTQPGGVDDSMDTDDQVSRTTKLYDNKPAAEQPLSLEFNNGSIFGPPQFDRPVDERPELAIKPGNVPSEDQDIYRNPNRKIRDAEASGSSSRNVSHPSSPAPFPVAPIGALDKDADAMEIDSPAIEGSGDIVVEPETERAEIVTKEIKFEATTTWYARWYKEGRGWEHIYVESSEKAFKYLGVK